MAADLSLCAGYYGRPSANDIADYAEELAQLLSKGYVSQYEFGFKLAEQRVVSWRYVVDESGVIANDDGAGRVFAHAEVRSASYYNYMSYSRKWFGLPASEREAIKSGLPVQRSAGSLPSDGSGVWVSDKSYSANGVGLSRTTFKPNVS